MDGDTGKLHDLRNVKYKVEHERGSFAGIRFNRTKSKYREKKKQNLSRETEEDANVITKSDLAYVSVKIDQKSSVESKQYTKCARRKDFTGKTSIDFKPFKSMLSSFSFVGKDRIKEITSIDSHTETVVNEQKTYDLNLNRRVNNEVKVLYERDINEEVKEQNISRTKSGSKSRRTKNSQISLFGFQRCIQRKRQLNYNLNVFYKFLQSDAKRDKCLCCKHYSFEDVNPEKPKKKSSFVKSQSDNPTAPNLLKVTERTTVSNIYLLKPKDAKTTDSVKKIEIPCSCLELDKRKSILKKGDGFDNITVQTMKTKSKEKNIATADHLKTRPFSGGPTAVNVCKPTRICKKWIKVEPKVCDNCKQSKSTGIFNLFCAAIKYFLFITIVIIWLPCILVLGLVWLITYPFRPHQDPKGETKRKTTKKSLQKPPKNIKEIKCAYCKNKKKCYALLRKNKATSSKTNKKKMKGTNCQKNFSKCTQYTTTTATKLRLPESATTIMVLPCEGATSSLVGKKRHKSVTFKQSSKNRGTETTSNASKSKQTTCSGCWKKKGSTQKSVTQSLDKNQAKQDTKQKPKLNYKCQEIIIKSCQGIKSQNQKVEVCAPKSLSKVLQTALSGVCSNNNEFASIPALPKNKSCNNLDNKCVKCTKKRKFSNRWCSTTTPTKHMAVSTTSVIQCVPSPCPGSCAYTQAVNIQDAKGDKCEKSRTTMIKFFPPPRCKTNTVGSGINLRVCNSSKSTLAPFSSCCNRNICGKKSFKIISVNKLFPSLRPCLRTVSSNTIKPKTSSISKSKERKQDDDVGRKEPKVKKVEKQKEKDAKKCGKEEVKNIKKREKEEKKAKSPDKEKEKSVKNREKEEKKAKSPDKEKEKSVKKREKEEKKAKSSDKEKEKSVKKREKEEKKAKNPDKEKEKSVKKREKEEKKAKNPDKEKEKSVKKREKEVKKAKSPDKAKEKSVKKDEKKAKSPDKEKEKSVKKREKEEKKAKSPEKEKEKSVKKREKEEKKAKSPDKEKEKSVKKREKEEKKAKNPDKEKEKSVKKREKEEKKAKNLDKEKEKSVKKREKEQKKAKNSDKEKGNPGKKGAKEEKKVNNPGKEKGNPGKKSAKEENKVNNPGKEKGNPGKKSAKEEKKANNPGKEKGNPGNKSAKVEKKVSNPSTEKGNLVKKNAKEEKRVNNPRKEEQKNVKKYDKPFYVKKYLPAPTPIGRHMSSNTDVEMSSENLNTESPKSNTVVKYIPPPYERTVTSGVNTSNPQSPSTGKFKSKSSSACFTTATKILKFFPKPRSYSVGSITTEVKLPLKPLKKQKAKKKTPSEKGKPVCKPPGLLLQDRKSFARRRSQEMKAGKPVHIHKFFPSPIPCTRSISIGARLQDEVKIPRKSSKSTTFPQKPFFRSLTATMATNTCSVGPTRIFKYIKSKKSFITRGTVPQKFKEEKVSKSDTSIKKSVDKTSKKGKKPVKPTKRKKKKKRPSRVRFFVRGKSIGKRSTGSNTRRIYTKSREVMLKPTGPLIRFFLPKKPLTSTRGVNPRKEKFCFMRELRGFPKKQICKYRKTSVIIPKKIVIYKRPDQSPESSPSSRSAADLTTASSRSKSEGKQQAKDGKKQAKDGKKQAKKQAKERAKQRADSVKQRAKEKAKEKDMEKDKDRATALAIKEQKARAKDQAKQRADERADAIAKQKAEFRAQDLKAQEEMRRLQRKNREKARKRKPKLTFKQNAGLFLKQLKPVYYNIECQDLISRGPKPCKLIYDLWPSAYPAFMVLYKMYNNVMRLFFFFLACCVWSPLFSRGLNLLEIFTLRRKSPCHQKTVYLPETEIFQIDSSSEPIQ
ncbi:PREDICTED: uncharacterized protein LOC106115556 [Papilio xuthus]|uniref:Uncharacterized protein LOC106115556 n=1 Tax=Papilio xuthus TaxID=66420 RepID=A0AAJ6Z349_PAPXU|nr:PREDICTED: uncharacterized protein LOC106115556 [Papilio xuthus]